MRRPAPLFLTFKAFSASLFLLALAAEPGAAGEAPVRPWTSDLLRDIAAWPHAEGDARIAATPAGLRVEVAEGRRFAIAAASRLALPKDLGRIRVRVAKIGGGGSWFVRLYGDLRKPGEPRTAAIAQSETAAGERTFDLDPRMRGLPDAPLQLQLGVEGPPGAFAAFEDVAMLPETPRSNRGIRRTFQPGQTDIAAVELMPNLPEPFEVIDWREKARAYDRLAFDGNGKGEFLPLLWLDGRSPNTGRPVFGLPSYVGDPRGGPGRAGAQEGITCMGAILGATLAGIDKRQGDQNYVRMCEAWFNSGNGLNLVLNLQRQETGGSFWYEIWPHIVFYAIADRYPEETRLAEILRITADRWRRACLDLAGPNGVPDFDHTSFDFRARKPVDNGRWKEPDAAAGVAWLEYAAWMKFHDPGHLAAAEGCLQFLEGLSRNPYYEVLLPYGALVAARMEAELGRGRGADRLLDWCFGVSDCRGGWGATVGSWGGYDCDGLLGSIDDRGGYAFAMNTFAQAGALVPLARYDPRRARAIGKWMLNLASAARLFYPDALPEGHGTSEAWKGDPEHAIAYEGLRREWRGKSPCATGDPVAMGWGPKTDLGLYGSGYAGILGAIVGRTSEPRILRLDCLATDFFRGPAYPTFLFYNPYPDEKSLRFDAGPKAADLYDAAAHRFVKREALGETELSLPADSAAVIVLVPAGAKAETSGKRLTAGGVVVDYATGR